MNARQRTALELQNTYSGKLAKRRWRDIVNRISEMGVPPTLRDNPRLEDLMKMVDNPDEPLSFGDLGIFAMFDKWIFDRDVRAGEFLRDTKGEKPTNQLEVTDKTPLRNWSTEDLTLLLEQARAARAIGMEEGDIGDSVGAECMESRDNVRDEPVSATAVGDRTGADDTEMPD